jgi:hypothetical protein
MTTKINGPKKPAAPKPAGPGNVVRPMYGIFIRDRLAEFRSQLGVTIADTQHAIAQGKPKQAAVFGDGVLQGAELTKAKAALADMQKALKALKPAFGGPGTAPTTADVRADLGRPGGGFVAMYGVVLRDDLSRFRTGVGSTITDIQAAITSGQLKGNDKKEAQAAIKFLKQAVKDLGPVAR